MLHNLLLSVGFGIITASIIALAAVGVTLQFGVTNHVNFAYGSYLALAAYLAYEFNTALGLNFWFALVLSAGSMGLFAVVISRVILQPFLRRSLPTIYMLIVTLGLWLILSNAILVIWGANPRAFNISNETPLSIGPFLFTTDELAVVGIAIAILIAVHVLLTRTKLGKAMRALSDDRQLAQVSGISADLIVNITWALTGALIGIAGCVLALNLSSFLPGFGDDYLFIVYAAVILGGIGHPYGAMLGALIVGLATEMSAVIIPPVYKADVAFLLLIAVLFIRPQGLIPARGFTQ